MPIVEIRPDIIVPKKQIESFQLPTEVKPYSESVLECPDPAPLIFNPPSPINIDPKSSLRMSHSKMFLIKKREIELKRVQEERKFKIVARPKMK